MHQMNLLSILYSQNLPGFVAEVSGRVLAQMRLLDVEPGPLNTGTNMTEKREKGEKKNDESVANTENYHLILNSRNILLHFKCSLF